MVVAGQLDRELIPRNEKYGNACTTGFFYDPTSVGKIELKRPPQSNERADGVLIFLTPKNTKHETPPLVKQGIFPYTLIYFLTIKTAQSRS